MLKNKKGENLLKKVNKINEVYGSEGYSEEVNGIKQRLYKKLKILLFFYSYTNCVNSKKYKINIFGQEIEAIIDTGSDVTICDLSLINGVNISIVKSHVKSANGSKIYLAGLVKDVAFKIKDSLCSIDV